jgi:bacillithiol biosynthesis cysteine-adding enzyme BshC
VASNPNDSRLLSSAELDRTASFAVDIRRFSWIRRLAADYAYDFPRISSFFSGDPADRAAWGEVIKHSQSHARRRQEIADVVAAQQQRRGSPDRAVDAARQLADPRTVAVVTGQQAVLFGGPMFTLLKALTALKLAAHISIEHGVPAVAVFWVESEDHDWNEVRSCKVLDEGLAVRTLSLPPQSDSDHAPVSAVHLDQSIDRALEELARSLPPTEFGPALIPSLRQAYGTGKGMSEAFGCWLDKVLGDRGLIVYDASDRAAKQLAAGVFHRELSMPGETGRLASAAGAELVKRGYHVQVQTSGENLALFHLDGAGRRAIRVQDGQFMVGNERYPAAALVQEAAEKPHAFSPSVLLRPIVQDTLFPTVCYVAGPNELAYLGQLRGVYEHFGVPMPLMYPRASATLVDSAALRFLNRYRLPLEALQPRDDAALNQLLETQIPPVVEQSFSSASRTIEAEMARVVGAVPALDPTLEGAAQSTLDRMRHDLQTLHGKMIQAAKRRDETLRRQFTRTRALAFPDGEPQERAIAFVSFLNQYGPALVDRLEQSLPLELGHHRVVAI